MTTPASPLALPIATPRWKIDFLMLAMIWGASFLFMRTAAVEFGALPTAALRVCIAALFFPDLEITILCH